ncbi:hypothetical protein M8C13_39220 [Crossiella sp. SN42]|uniref:hypothetical protein n=1 Tax=Crossiella sp. SN42 TaxID=2944808 RepID=UPI00207D2C00|nr:hypothetical protein [Crossiella sp. SN42]MCO1581799.1 hypothetical protein [Crossiella sp. SN42]
MTSGAATLAFAERRRAPKQLGTRSIVLVVLASVAGLIGLVGPEGRRLTDLSTRPVIELNFGQLVTVGAGMIGIAAGLCLIRRWPWLLLAGAMAGVPAAVVRIWPTLLHETTWPEKYTTGQDGILDTLTAGGTMGGSLLIAGILGAAQQLARAGSRAAAAAVVAAMIGAELFSRILFGRPVPVPGPPPPDTAVALLTVVGLTGAVLAVLAAATGRLTEPAEYPPDRRMLQLGLCASAIPLLPKVISAFFPGGPQSAAEVGVSAATALAATVAVAVIAGAGVLGAVVVVTAAALAASAPLFAAYYAMTVAATPILPVAATGLALGVLAATIRHRLLAAAGVCLGLAAVALTAPELPGRGLRALLEHNDHLPAELVMVLVIVAVILAAGAVAPGLADRGALPMALGPLFTGLALAGQELMYFSGKVSADTTVLGRLYGPQPIALAGGMLALAGFLLLYKGILYRRRTES